MEQSCNWQEIQIFMDTVVDEVIKAVLIVQVSEGVKGFFNQKILMVRQKGPPRIWRLKGLAKRCLSLRLIMLKLCGKEDSILV